MTKKEPKLTAKEFFEQARTIPGYLEAKKRASQPPEPKGWEEGIYEAIIRIFGFDFQPIELFNKIQQKQIYALIDFIRRLLEKQKKELIEEIEKGLLQLFNSEEFKKDLGKELLSKLK